MKLYPEPFISLFFFFDRSHPVVLLVDCVWNVMAHAQKPDFVFRRNGRVHLNRRERQFSRLLAAEVCASAVVMLDTPCSQVVWRVLATYSIRQFPLHLPPCVTVCHDISTGVYHKVGSKNIKTFKITERYANGFHLFCRWRQCLILRNQHISANLQGDTFQTAIIFLVEKFATKCYGTP